jgi:hypothetical protein
MPRRALVDSINGGRPTPKMRPSETLTKPGCQTSRTAAAAPRAGSFFQCASSHFCFGAAASHQPLSTDALAVVRHRLLLAEQRPRERASARRRRPAEHPARPWQCRLRQSSAGWCRERPAQAISTRNESGWWRSAQLHRGWQADPAPRRPQRRASRATYCRHRTDIVRWASSAPLPPQIFVWQATGHGGRIGEAMQPAWAWLPKWSRRCFRRGARLVSTCCGMGGASLVSARTLQQADVHRVRTRHRLSQINKVNFSQRRLA